MLAHHRRDLGEVFLSIFIDDYRPLAGVYGQ
jgi:hypothetical protein